MVLNKRSLGEEYIWRKKKDQKYTTLILQEIDPSETREIVNKGKM